MEFLEARWLPATIKLIAGNLFISNPTIVGGASNVTIKLVGANTFDVTDAGKTVTVGGVGRIQYTGSNLADTVSLDLNGKSFGGSFQANTGNGFDKISVLTSSAGGAILGNVALQTGAGDDTVEINDAGGGSLTVGGSLQVVSTYGADKLSISGAFTTTVGGSVLATKIATVTIGQSGSVAIGGSLVVANDTLATPSNINITGNSAVTSVRGGVSIRTGGVGDSVTLGNVDFNGGNGSTQISTGGGNDTVLIGNGNTTIHGNFSLTEGDGDDQLTVTSGSATTALEGNASVDLGAGNDTMTANTPTFTVNGNLSVALGSGNDTADLSAASINGRLNISAGTGDDTVTVGEPPAGLLTFLSGGGDDQLTLAPTVDGNWNVFLLFGTGGDKLTLGGVGNQTLKGIIDFVGPAGSDTLIQGANWSLIDVQILGL